MQRKKLGVNVKTKIYLLKNNSQKELEIKDNNIEAVYKKLYRYRHKKNITFKIENDNYSLTPIINALNIKNKKDRLAYVYDTACKEIDNRYKGINICGFKNKKCFVQIKKPECGCYGCCRKCKYVTNTGCSTMNLACKLFFCSEVKDRYDIINYDDIKILKMLTKRQQFIVKSDYFSLRESVIKDLSYNSLLVAMSRMLYRLIRRKDDKRK